MASLIPSWEKKIDAERRAAEDLWLMLLDENHTPDAINQRYVGSVVANEIPATSGYVAGGIHIVAGKTVQPHGNNYYLDLPDQDVGPGANLNYRYGILYTKTGGSSQNDYRILAQIDFVTNQIVTNGTSTIEWNALGIIYIQ